MEYRKRYGEKLKADSPVFRNQFDRNDPSSVHYIESIKQRSVEQLISRAIEKSGIRTVQKTTELDTEKGKIRKPVRLTSGFRKFFDTQLIYSKVEPRTKEMLMGHSIGLDDHYFKPEENYVLEQYLRAVENLTVNEENRLRIKVHELTTKNETNESIIRCKLTEKDNEIQTLKEEMKSIKEFLKFPEKLTEIAKS